MRLSRGGQSSTQYGGVSSRAVDGNVNPFFSHGSVTYTGVDGKPDAQPYWEVDLGAWPYVGTVRLWNQEQVRARARSM